MMVTKDDSAYTYLPDSVKNFPDGEDFIKILKKVNFKIITEKRVSFGIATIYVAEK